MSTFFGFDNKYGRPIPYVWFLIIMVSSIPLILLYSVSDALPCTETDILNGITPEQYFKEKKFTIEEAVKECSETIEGTLLAGKIVSGLMFFSMVIFMKPWPLSNPQEDDKSETKTERKTPI